MTIPQEAIETVAIHMAGESRKPDNFYEYPHNDSDRARHREKARAALEAALPHIREQIAQDVERGELSGGVIFGCPLCPDVWESEPTCAHYPAFEHAARIVRGEQ